MTIFDKLFGRRPTKFDLIRNLLKARLCSDPMAQLAGVNPNAVDSEPDTVVLVTPEGTITTIVEIYIAMKRQGVPEEQILLLIEEHRSVIGAGTVVWPLTLRSYIRYRVPLEHSPSAPVSDDSLDHSIQEALKFFESA